MQKESSESKKLIPIYLIKLFLERTDKNNFIDMKEIQSYLENKQIYADTRTVYSAIHNLQYAGFDIEGVPIRRGYHYHLNSRTFDTNELKFLIDSVATSKFLTRTKAKELIDKIKSLGSIHEAAALNRNTLVGERIKSMNDTVLKNLDIIYDSINKNTQISFEYYRWNPDKKLESTTPNEPHIISPFAVSLNDNNYYLISYHSKFKKLLHYRIDKMKYIKQLDIPRVGIETFRNFNIVDYSRKTFNMYSGKEANISLQCKDNLVGVFIDRFGDSVSIRPDYQNSGYSICKFDVNVSPQFYSWIFGLGADVTILSPQSAIDEFKEMAKTILNNYNRNDR